MKKQALLFRGGWDGHEPVPVSEVFASLLKQEGFCVEISDTLDVLLDTERLMQNDLIVQSGQWAKSVQSSASPSVQRSSLAAGWPAVTAACATHSATVRSGSL